jgi:ATP-dependent Clp protease ATP-binding subunit ClpA
MDHGKLTDNNGKSVDFRNVILIMTSNVGAAELAKSPIGFGRKREAGDDEDAINRMFSPEFRNRLDAIISFNPLPREVVHRVVEKFVLQLETQLAERNVTISLTPEAADWLAKRGYSETMGARPLSRVIQEYIKKPLADEVLFGPLIKGGSVKVSVVGEGDDAKLELVSSPPTPARPKAITGPKVARKRKASPKVPSKAKPGPKAKAKTKK